MELTQDDLKLYFEKLVISDQITETMYQGVLTDRLHESMQLLKTPYFFYTLQ